MMRMTHPACIVVMTTVPFPVDPLVMACIPFVCLCVSLRLYVSLCVPVCLCISMHLCEHDCVLLFLTSNFVCVCVYPCFNTNICSLNKYSKKNQYTNLMKNFKSRNPLLLRFVTLFLLLILLFPHSPNPFFVWRSKLFGQVLFCRQFLTFLTMQSYRWL